MFSEYTASFGNREIVEFDAKSPPENLGDRGWRVALSYDAADGGMTYSQLLAQFLNTPGTDQLEVLVVGAWEGLFDGGEGAERTVEALVSARERMPNLKHLFFGDILGEECEVSWIEQTDVSPLFLAFPHLETLKIRGANGLSLGNPNSATLKTLIIECGGLNGSVIREITGAHLPALEHLELYLGEDNYGRDIAEEDLHPILSGDLFPQLTYLGLKDDEEADATIALVAKSAILKRIETLDVSLGTLTDAGAEVLLASPAVRTLKKLDLHHHFLSDGMIGRLKTELDGIALDLSEQQEAEDEGDGDVYRYIAVGE